jgi:hypothetical protein
MAWRRAAVIVERVREHLDLRVVIVVLEDAAPDEGVQVVEAAGLNGKGLGRESPPGQGG